MEVTAKRYTYTEVKNGIVIEGDDYGLAAGLTETRKRTFFANPNQKDNSQYLLNLELVDGIVAGRSMMFETKIKVGNDYYPGLSGSTLDVPEDYRHSGIGADLFYFFSQGTAYQYNICSGISDMALPLYKALKYKILEFPRMMLLCDSKPIVESYGIKGILGGMVSSLVNIPIKFVNGLHKWQSKKIVKKFEIKKETVIPDWVDDMVLNDGHKYMEVHDKAWLQWNLDYNFKGDKEDIQSFYSIYKDGRPQGFFMTKERYRAEAGGKLKDFVLGAIVEWGISKDCDTLSEAMINKMALSTFTDNVGIIEFATADNDTCRQMKRWGFIHHGFAHIAFKDKKKACKDAGDIELWRVRYGYADVILT